MFTPARRRPTSWFVALTILLASLLPTLAQALSLDRSVGWVEVCTLQGSKWVQADADAGPTPAPGGKHLLEHCPYCAIHVPVLGLPPSPALAPRVPGLAHERPLAFFAAPRTLHAWVSAQPRAPPART